MAPPRQRGARAAALALAAALLAVLLPAPSSAQPAAGITLQDVCNAPTPRYLAASFAKRAVTGTSCTVFVDCTSRPLTAQACVAGQRFSVNDQQCLPAASTPCYEDQFPTPAGAKTNRALVRPSLSVPSANTTGNQTDGNQTVPVVVTPWTPTDWQLPTPATPGGNVAAAADSPNSSAMSKDNYNYHKTCNTVAFQPERHTPPSSSGVSVPASVSYLTTCTVCYPAILCPNSPKFSASVKGDYMLHLTTDYYACDAGMRFDGQACTPITSTAAATPAASQPSIDVSGSVTRGIDCDSMRAALTTPSSGTTFTLVDTVCNSTVAPLGFGIVNSTSADGQEVVTLKFKMTSLLRWTQALVYNSTTGARGKSGEDQFTVNPTSLASFVAHTSPEGVCTFVPLVNGTAQPPAPGTQCPNPNDPKSLSSLRDNWYVFAGLGGVGALGAGIGAYSIYSIYMASEVFLFGDEAMFAALAAPISAVSAAGAVIGIVLLLAAIVLLVLILTGVIPPDMGVSSGCFPASATVLGLLATSSMLGTVPMGQLALGDAVATASLAPGGVYGSGITTSPVYLFGHQTNDVLATFVELQTASGHTLHMTGGHFLPSWPALAGGASPASKDTVAALATRPGCHVDGTASSASLMRMKRAQDVSPDGAEQLCVYDEASGTFALSPVVGKRFVQMQGLYAPFTTTGDLVVNGVLVSSHSDWILDRIAPAKAVHYLPAVYQALMSPARVAYALGGRRLMEFLSTQLRLVELASAVRL